MRTFDITDGRQTLALPVLALGSIYFGMGIPDEEFFGMIDRYRDAGGTLIDTARCYANWLPGGEGSSEKAIGRYLAARGGRGDLLIATKAGNTKKGENPYRANLSEAGLRAELEESLRCLGVDCADLWYLHRDDPRLPVEEIVERVNGFIREGKIRMAGVSNWTAPRLLAANAYAKAHGLRPFVINQVQYSLAQTSPARQGDLTLVCLDEEGLEPYRQAGIPLASFTSLAKGFFTKYLRGGEDAVTGPARDGFYSEENLRRAARVRALGEACGLSATQTALAFVTSALVPCSAVLGARDHEQLADSLAAADITLTGEQRAFLLS